LQAWLVQTTERLKSGTPADTLIAELSESIPRLMDEHRVPGLSIAVVRDARLLWTQGFGIKSASTKEPVTADTVFEAASLSKPAFAYAALRIFERDKRSLDVPLAEYVPATFVTGDPGIARVTARQVLSHSSGLPHGREPGTTVQLRFAPGTRFGYSATGMQYLQFVVEQLSKRTLRELMRTNLLDPFGMSASSFGWLERYAKEAAGGHGQSGRPGLSGNGQYLQMSASERGRMRLLPDASDDASASAGFYTTASDYARFMIEIMQPAKRGEYHLSDDAVTEMLKPQIDVAPGIAWGLGWGIEQTPSGNAYWHWGDWGVFRNFAIAFKAQRTGVVVLTNSFNGPQVYARVIPSAIGETHPAFAWVNSYRP
jgi:CubicO group peptidase (beta-lactamase class C family)